MEIRRSTKPLAEILDDMGFLSTDLHLDVYFLSEVYFLSNGYSIHWFLKLALK